jgi:hypothetical protein
MFFVCINHFLEFTSFLHDPFKSVKRSSAVYIYEMVFTWKGYVKYAR